jgi:hypothetical protein
MDKEVVYHNVSLLLGELDDRLPGSQTGDLSASWRNTTLVDGLRGYDYPALTQLLFNTAITAGEAEGQPHGVTDDFARNRRALVPGSGWRGTPLFMTSPPTNA